VSWSGADELVVSLRGNEISGYDVYGWQCTIDLARGRIGVSSEQRAHDADTFTKREK
jgi:hypothetical protein